MIYRDLNEFFADWEYESTSTLKVLQQLTDESMDTRITLEGRTLGFLGWHITESIGEMMNRTGLKVFTPDLADGYWKESSSDDLKKCYKNASDSLIEKLRAGWDNDTLKIEDDMYGEKWNRGTTLSILIAHQVHHRGQMTVLMRQAGLKVPGFYGPSKEEWIAMGIEPMK